MSSREVSTNLPHVAAAPFVRLGKEKGVYYLADIADIICKCKGGVFRFRSH